MPCIAKVAVNDATIHFDKLYSYLVPPDFSESLWPGSIVLVPFGRGNHPRMAVVLEVGTEEAPDPRLKSLLAAAPEKARLTPDLLELVHFLKDRYFCTWYEAVKAVIPYGAQYQPGMENGKPVLKSRLTRTLETVYTLVGGLPEKPKPGARQIQAVEALRAGPCTKSALEAQGISSSTLNGLCQKGILKAEQRDKSLDLFADIPFDPQPLELSPEQQTAYDQLEQDLLSGQTRAALLHGVTGSGKTVVYIRLAQELLKIGRSVMILVPEIALTPQMMARFTAYFGREVALLHSGLRMTERYDQFKRLRRGEAHIVLGTRSAVFAPLENLGLIIMDEEQEGSYQSENAPCYHARDVAKYRCAAEGARLLLGSATPTVETFYHAQQGEYDLLELTERYNRRALPEVRIADLRQELRAGNSTVISRPLQEELAKNIAAGEQSILFLNRRGSSRQLLCPQCGYVPECPRCSVYLTYHSANDRLMCHYCGYSHAAPTVCPECGGTLKHIGFGTQRVEEELHELFPGVEVLRMDADTVSVGHEALLKEFEERQIPILLGTQMVAKGLDFANVTLVGVLSADLSLYVDHYRAAERTFNLLTQVVGRAGRGDKAGRAVIQTYTPENDVIQAAAAQDYQRFYDAEITLRRLRQDPPFADQFTVTVTGPEETPVRRAIELLRQGIGNAAEKPPYDALGIQVIGPAPAPVVKVNGVYRYRLLVLGQNIAPMRELLAGFMRAFVQRPENRRLHIYTDCDKMD